jgi:membrane-associated phospholipid phosphatase
VLLSINSEPWFAGWNYRILSLLFRLLPMTGTRASIAEFFIINSLASTWIFAAAYYLLWRIEDKETGARRTRLVEIPLACVLGFAVTLAIRPWVGWPSPARNPDLQSLFPYYLWAEGTRNSFPSHSTLICLIVAIGLLPVSRKIGALLIAFTLLGVSFPRVYIGGHYPIDVAASVILGVISCAVMRRAGRAPRIREGLAWAASRGVWTEFFLLLWTFELGEGFRSSLMLLRAMRHIAGRLA